MSAPWRGSREASGVLLGGPGVDALEVQHRALTLLAPGVRLFAIDAPARMLVLFAATRRLRAENAPGALIVAIERRLCAADVDPARVAQHAAGALLVEASGAIASFELDASREIQPHRWLDVSAIALVPSVALASPPSPAALAAQPPLDARAALGDAIPERAPGAQHAAASLAALVRGSSPELSGEDGSALPPRHAASPARALLLALVTVLAPLVWLFSWIAARARPASSGTAAPTASAPPSWLARLRALGAEWLLRTRLGAFLQRRQAEYLRRLFDLFEGDDIDEILRWAIPLGGGTEAGLAQPALLPPGPRDSIAIPLHHQAGPVVDFGRQIEAMLRGRYELLFDRLQREERIAEAAYVRAELLGDVAGAVALLERHGRIVPAARLAEARRLPAEQVVRLWTLARDIDRAIAIGRRDGVLPQAIALLRSVRPEAAATLALRWGEQLAEAGEHAAAAQAVRDISGAEALERAWVALAIEAGGVGGARMLARLAAIDASAWPDVKRRAEELLGAPTPERKLERSGLAKSLAAEAATPAVSALRGLCARALLAHDPTEAGLARGLANASQDVVLARDLPRAAPARAAATSEALSVRVPADDVGGIAVHDAALLPDGRVLVALGEAGLRLYGRDGRLRASIAVPATALVVSDTGTRALALAPRGGLVRIARIDLQSHRAQTFWEAPLTSWADSFDGDRWLVVERERALAIDATADTWSALWRAPEGDRAVDSRFVHARRFARQWVLHSLESDRTGGQLQRWTFDEKSTRFRERAPMPVAANLRLHVPPPSAAAWSICLRETDQHAPVLARHAPQQEILLGDVATSVMAFDGELTAATALDDVGLRVTVVATAARVLARVHLEAAAGACVRIANGLVTVCDDRGRVLVIDPRAAAVARDLRVRP